MSDRVYVAALPSCDLCRSRGTTTEATYDGKTVMGPWANMCQEDFESYGVGLGTGRGQRLLVRPATSD